MKALRFTACLLMLALLLPAACAEDGAQTAETAAPAQTVVDTGESPAFVPALLAVAEGELGYTEGPNNHTKYGEWSGDPNAAWCAEFICWCVDQTDQQYGYTLLDSVIPQLRRAERGAGLVYRTRTVYIPQRQLPGVGLPVAQGRGSPANEKRVYPPPRRSGVLQLQRSGRYRARRAGGILHSGCAGEM